MAFSVSFKYVMIAPLRLALHIPMHYSFSFLDSLIILIAITIVLNVLNMISLIHCIATEIVPIMISLICWLATEIVPIMISLIYWLATKIVPILISLLYWLWTEIVLMISFIYWLATKSLPNIISWICLATTSVLLTICLATTIAFILAVLVDQYIFMTKTKEKTNKPKNKIQKWKGPKPTRIRNVFGKKIMTLYHVTDANSARLIFQKRRMLRGATGMFGGGIYFAETVTAAKHKAHRHGVVITAKVFVGKEKVVMDCSGGQFDFRSLQKMGFDSVNAPKGSGWGEPERVVYNSIGIKSVSLNRNHTNNIRACFSV